MGDAEMKLMKKNCGEERSESSSKCLSVCNEVALMCQQRTKTTSIDVLQECILDTTPTERGLICNICISEQVANNCPWWFNYLQQTGGDHKIEDTFELEDPSVEI